MMTTIEKINEMGSIHRQWGLFNLKIETDKTGSGLWSCKILSADSCLAEGFGDTFTEAVNKCWFNFMTISGDWVIQ